MASLWPVGNFVVGCWGSFSLNSCLSELESMEFESLNSSDFIDVLDISEIDSVVDISPSDLEALDDTEPIGGDIVYRGESENLG